MPNPNVPKPAANHAKNLLWNELDIDALYNKYMLEGGGKSMKKIQVPPPYPQGSTEDLYEYINKLEIRLRDKGKDISNYRRELMYEKARNLALQDGVIQVQSFARAVNKALKRHGAKVRLSHTTNQASLAAELAEILWNICGREAVED